MGALDGVRVIEAATLMAGPLMGTYLAELGADVIHVEPPGAGDPVRHWGPEKNEVGLMWKSVGRNKRCITLNLRQEEGREILRDLAKGADVLITNFRLPTLQAWKLDYPDFEAVNKGIVYLHLSGFGRGGPFSDRAGFGTLGEAMSTFAHLTGLHDGPPTLPPMPLADGVASLNGAYAILAALYHRDARGGEGQLIDVNLIDPLSRLLEMGVLQYDQLGTIQQRRGNIWEVSVPRGAYKAGDGRWIGLSGSSPAVARRVFQAIDRADLAEDPRYSDMQGRLDHVAEIDEAIGEWIERHDLDVALKRFDEFDVPACPIYDAKQLMEDEHVIARNTYVTCEDRELGSMRVQAPVPRLSKTAGTITHLAPKLGQHNNEIYGSLLAMSQAEIDELKRKGTI